tara:strand:- start:3334 stop:5193 length:1860 start_codon:yes stop_codon:yes gene_type:complete
MCGFTGFVGKFSNPKEKLEYCNKILFHRGPDMSDTFYDEKNKIGLAHSRLSILDISSNAMQPIKDNLGNVLIFNGEIYNHKIIKKRLDKIKSIKWNSTSDTEILFNSLIYFGIENTLENIEGMYAFCFFKKNDNTIYLCRDISGEKPLYYYQSDDKLIFSSEVKPINYLIGKKNISIDTLKNYINFNFNWNNNSLFLNIFSLMPGNYLKFNLNKKKIIINNFWKYEKKYQFLKKNNKSSKINFNNLLKNEVKKELISDVPVGAFMSSGLDSTLVASVASTFKKDIQIYSIGYEDKNFDESAQAQKISNYLNINFNKIIFKSSDVPSLFEELTDNIDLPHTDQSDLALYLLCKNAKKNGSKVILTGDGGDELFGGYNRHIWGKNILEMKPLIKKPLNFFLKFQLTISTIEFLNNLLPRKYFQLDLKSKIQKFSKVLNYKNLNDIYLFLLKNNYESDLTVLPYNKDMSNLRNMLKYDFQYYLPNNVLYKSDRCSMYNSIEIRAPLLSKNIIEYSLSMLDQDIVSDFQGKLILRKAIKEYLPETLIQSKKSGFSIPLAKWIRGPLNDWGKNIFFDPIITKNYLIKINYSKIWESYIEGDDNYFQKVWNIMILNSWIRKNIFF